MSHNAYRHHDICRACGSKDLFDAVDFGLQVPANSFRPRAEIQQEKFPLLLRVCAKCTLGQLAHVVSKEDLYTYYPYVTSTGKTMTKHLQNLCQNILSRVKGMPRVVEIGSNTGVFLKMFQEFHARVHGFEPALNLATVANNDLIPTTPEFFNQATATSFAATQGPADVIIGRHVLAHIDCWRALVSALDAIAGKKTLIVFEVPYIVDIVDGYQFDTIYHEHLSYVGVRSMIALLMDSPFYVAEIARVPMHGGSLIFFLKRRGVNRVPPSTLDHFLTLEERAQLSHPDMWRAWAKEISAIREDVVDIVRTSEGVAGYGASAKGSMLTQYCGLTAKDLLCVFDNTPSKQGTFVPGTKIPIMPASSFDQFAGDGRVRNALILAWNFAAEIKAQHPDFKGKWITPIPSVRIH